MAADSAGAAPLLSLPPTILKPGDRVCCAVSGGADSTALLLLLHAANTLPRQALGVGLSAIHINHQLRGAESDGDQAFVEGLCRELAVPLTVRPVATTAFKVEAEETLEEAARTLRYREFEALLRSGAASHILTAHTLDDQAETVLIKLLRGAWLEGLSAIAPVLDLPPGKVLRPLLRVCRPELRTYLEARGVRIGGALWREDSSNSDEAFTRNRVRHSILPVLRKENPRIDQTLANLAELAREEEARWQTELKRLLPQLVLPGKPVRGGGRANSTAPGEQALAIELERLRALEPALRRRIVRAAARQLGVRLSFEETERLLSLAGAAPSGLADPTVPARPCSSLTLSQNLLAERSLRELRLSRPVTSETI